MGQFFAKIRNFFCVYFTKFVIFFPRLFAEILSRLFAEIRFFSAIAEKKLRILTNDHLLNLVIFFSAIVDLNYNRDFYFSRSQKKSRILTNNCIKKITNFSKWLLVKIRDFFCDCRKHKFWQMNAKEFRISANDREFRQVITKKYHKFYQIYS